jgi:hypothetical protein
MLSLLASLLVCSATAVACNVVIKSGDRLPAHLRLLQVRPLIDAQINAQIEVQIAGKATD